MDSGLPMKRFLFAWKKILIAYTRESFDKGLNKRRHGDVWLKIKFCSIAIAVFLFFFFALPHSVNNVYADTCVAAGTGDWDANATWNTCNEAGTGYPDSNDTVNITGTYTITIRNAAGIDGQAGSLNCALAAAGTCTIAVETGRSLTVTNGILLERANYNTALNISGAGTVNAASITIGSAAVNPTADRTNILTSTITSLNITGNIDINSYEGTANTSENLARLFLYGGTMDVDGIINVNSDGAAAAYSQFLLSGATSAPTLNIAGSGDAIAVDTGSTFTPAATNYVSIVNYNGADQTVRAATYDSLTLSGSGTKTMTSVATITNNLSVEGSASATSGSNMTIGGTLNIGSSASFTFGGTNTYTVTGATTVDGTLTASTTGATQTYTGGITVNGTFNLTSSNTKTFSNDVTINNGSTWNNSANAAITMAGNLTVNGGTITWGTGVHTMSGAAKSINAASSTNITIPSLTVSGTVTNNLISTNSETLTVTTALAGAGTLTQAANAELVLSGTSAITNLAANSNPNQVTYNGSGQTVKGTTYHNLTLAGSGTATTGTTTTVNNDLTISSGTYSATSSLTVTGAVSIANGAVLTSSTTLALNGTNTVNTGGTLQITSTTNTKTISDLILSTGAAMNFTAAEAVTMNGSLTINGTGDITGTSGLWTFQDTTSGTIGGTKTTATTFPSATFTQAYDINIPVTVSGTLTVTGVTVTNNSDVIVTTALSGTGNFTQGNGSNLTINGTSAITTLTASTNSNNVYYKGTAQTIKATTYYNLLIQPTTTTTDVLAGGSITVNNNLTIGDGSTTTTVQATTNDPNLSILGNFIVNANATFTGSDLNTATMNVDGNVTVNSGAPANGVFTAYTGNTATAFTLGGNFTNNGTFNANTGRIIFDDAGKTSTLSYAADTTFFEFYVVTAGKDLVFDSAQKTTVSSNLTLTGSDCDIANMVTLNSDSPPTKFTINSTGTENITYTNVSNSIAESAITLTLSNGSNFTNWNFTAPWCGTFSLSHPGSVTLSNISIDAPSPDSTGSLGTTNVTDTRGLSFGWSLIATTTHFGYVGNPVRVSGTAGGLSLSSGASYNFATGGTYTVTITRNSPNAEYSVTGLESTPTAQAIGNGVAIGTRGVTVDFAAGSYSVGESWTITVRAIPIDSNEYFSINPDNSTLTAVSGSLTGVTAGPVHAFTGTADPANILTAISGAGEGEYEIDPDLSLTIPIGTYVGNYSATMTLTLN